MIYFTPFSADVKDHSLRPPNSPTRGTWSLHMPYAIEGDVFHRCESPLAVHIAMQHPIITALIRHWETRNKQWVRVRETGVQH